MRADETDAELNSRAGFMPPVTSRPGMRTGQSISGGDRMAPPFVGGPKAEPFARAAAEPTPEPEPVTEPWEEPEAPPVQEVEEPWQAPPAVDEEDVEEPWAVAAVTETESPAEPVVDGAPQVQEAGAQEEAVSVDAFSVDAFSIDAFFTPDIEEVVTSDVVTEPPAARQRQPQLQSLAERLERVSQELRASDADAVIGKLARGDKLDALLAGLLAGFMAGSGE